MTVPYGLGPEEAVRHAVANAALEGFEFDEEWVERLRDVAYGRITADDSWRRRSPGWV